jgi:hypothetical protein
VRHGGGSRDTPFVVAEMIRAAPDAAAVKEIGYAWRKIQELLVSAKSTLKSGG